VRRVGDGLGRLGRLIGLIGLIRLIGLVGFVLALAGPAAADVTVERVTYMNQPNCIRLSNGTVELVITTAIGPRIIRYAFLGGDNVLGEVPDLTTKTTLGDWKPWGGHRLWSAPEGMPRSYPPDNSPIEARVEGNVVHLSQPVEAATGIRKEMTVTLAPIGTAVTIGHRLTNTSLWGIDAAAWALTIMHAGGAVVLPQEPYKSHDEELQPARSVTLWAYTDLSDPRWHMGPKFLRLKTDATRAASQKIGVANHQGWAAYLRDQTMFVKRVDWINGARYPDGGVNVETYTAGTFIELETLGPMAHLDPGGTLTHEERWFLFKNVVDDGTDDGFMRTLAPLLATTK
jgi:hypothetical protein